MTAEDIEYSYKNIRVPGLDLKPWMHISEAVPGSLETKVWGLSDHGGLFRHMTFNQEFGFLLPGMGKLLTEEIQFWHEDCTLEELPPLIVTTVPKTPEWVIFNQEDEYTYPTEYKRVWVCDSMGTLHNSAHYSKVSKQWIHGNGGVLQDLIVCWQSQYKPPVPDVVRSFYGVHGNSPLPPQHNRYRKE